MLNPTTRSRIIRTYATGLNAAANNTHMVEHFMLTSLSNSKILENYITALDTVIDSITTSYIIKDYNFELVYQNKLWKDIHTTETSDTKQMKELDAATNLKCVQNKAKIRLLAGRIIDDKFKFFNYNKVPIINHANNRVVGISVIGQELSTINLLNLTSVMNQNSPDANSITRTCWKKVKTKYAGLNLTLREEQILFFVLQFKTAEEIAGLLEQTIQVKISANTVRNIIVKQLHPKFNTNSTKVLIERALIKEYQFVVPTSVSKPFLVELH